MDIETRKEHLDRRMNSAARRVGREPSEIKLLAVSKTRSAETIRALAALGQHAFGENYLQEAVDKINQLDDLDLEWHFIGQMQRNKTAAVAENFDWVQSIDRLVAAERLSAQRPANLGDLNVCIQVQMSDEAGKGGIAPTALLALADAINSLPRLVLRGLMTIPENTTEIEKLKRAFAKMNNLYTNLKARYDTVDTLSMGMTNDFELAIEQGSTMIRVGTALFGPRDYGKSSIR
jgi:pyridoxal phosphate enzyme (YggS family)